MNKLTQKHLRNHSITQFEFLRLKNGIFSKEKDKTRFTIIIDKSIALEQQLYERDKDLVDQGFLIKGRRLENIELSIDVGDPFSLKEKEQLIKTVATLEYELIKFRAT